MNELPISEFKKAIKATHNCDSSFREIEAVHEMFQDQTVWRGDVLVFNLLGHPTANTCYAWSVEGRVTAVLDEGLVDSPRNAVQAAIVAERRKQ